MAAKLKIARNPSLLTHREALRVHQERRDEYEKLYGEPTPAVLGLIFDVAMLEQVKQQCHEHIQRAGVMTHWQNGNNQQGERENPLLSKVTQLTEQQRKLLAELQLTPASQKLSPQVQGGDDFDTF